MKAKGKIFKTVILCVCAVALVACALGLYSVGVALRTYNRNQAELAQSGFTEERPCVMEGILVYRHGGSWYLYPAGNIRQEGIYVLSDTETVSNGELETGQLVRVNYDGEVLEIYPPLFSEVFSVDILGTASGTDFEKAQEFFDTEIKPWHLP